jgi:hypothetical protein
MNFKDIPLIALGEISPISTNMIAPNTPHSKYSKLAKFVVNDTNFLPQKSWSIIESHKNGHLLLLVFIFH